MTGPITSNWQAGMILTTRNIVWFLEKWKPLHFFCSPTTRHGQQMVSKPFFTKRGSYFSKKGSGPIYCRPLLFKLDPTPFLTPVFGALVGDRKVDQSDHRRQPAGYRCAAGYRGAKGPGAGICVAANVWRKANPGTLNL